MLGFNRKDSKAELLGFKKLKIHGMSFTIKRLNPLLDFPADKIPQIFTDFQSKRNPTPDSITPSEVSHLHELAMRVVEAGVVKPELVPVGVGPKKGKEDGITVNDLFRNPEMGFQLFNEIINHSLNRFKGIKKLFFSIRAKYSFYTRYRKIMESLPST